MAKELHALTDSLAARLGRGVSIDDPSLRLLVYSPQHGQVDQVRLDSILHQQAPDDVVKHVLDLGLARTAEPVVRLPPVPELKMFARACAPLRASGELFGYLVAIDAEQNLTDHELEQIATTASNAAVVLHRERLLEDVAEGHVRAMMRDLLEEEEGLRNAADETLRGLNSQLQPPFRVTVVELLTEKPDLGADQTGVIAELVRRATFNEPGTISLTRADHVVVLHSRASERYDQTLEVLMRVRAEMSKRLAGGRSLHAGVGDRVGTLPRVRHSYLQARRALHVAAAVPGFGPHLEWSGLGVYRALAELASAGLATGVVPDEMMVLTGTTAGVELLRTVEVWLDQATDVPRAAELLHVHRTSVYYRLARFTELTGLDLHNGAERLAVHLGLKLARLEGRYLAPLPRGVATGLVTPADVAETAP